MTARLRWPILAATVVGLAVAIWAIGSVGLSDIAGGVARLGPGGFAQLWLASVGVLVILGAAWWAAMPGAPFRRLPLFVWARTVREGASDLLPFSALGGVVVGARTLIAAGLPSRRVHAAMIVDLTTEMLSQLLVTLFGLWALGALLMDASAVARLTPLAWAGAGVAVALTLAFVLLQRPALRLAGLLARRVLPGADAAVDAVLVELAGIYRHHGAVLLAFALNLAAWLASAGVAWLVLDLMDAEVSLARVVALEALIFALRSAAFVVPGALGVQEAGYVLLAPLFGVDPATAVTLSLIKRARDVAIGLPALLLWQAGELRAGWRAVPLPFRGGARDGEAGPGGGGSARGSSSAAPSPPPPGPLP